jgi:alanine-glyoxylate transaminase / serine-glyoxylate transaminase / serine-pyruvate transaminase
MMIPGPTQPDPGVLEVLAQPVLAHYGPQWKSIYEDTTTKLKKVFGTTKNDVLLVPTPGRGAVEMAVVNLVGYKGAGFVCVNGTFSGAIEKTIKAIGGRATVIASELGSGPTAENVSAALDNAGRDVAGRALFLVHAETSTGAATPPAEIFRVCKKKGVLAVLDAISTFGGMDVRMDAWGADWVVGYASKALGGIFGAQPVALSEASWEAAKKNKRHIRSLFLDLNAWQESIERDGSWGHPYPTSMPTSVIMALNKAVDLALAEGLSKRYERHARAASELRRGVEGLGLELFAEKGFYSDTLTAVKAPPGRSSSLLRSRMLEEHGIMVADGWGTLRGKIIRVGHMGTSAIPESIARVRGALADCLRDEIKAIQ